jgi:hypothetical protein
VYLVCWCWCWCPLLSSISPHHSFLNNLSPSLSYRTPTHHPHKKGATPQTRSPPILSIFSKSRHPISGKADPFLPPPHHTTPHHTTPHHTTPHHTTPHHTTPHHTTPHHTTPHPPNPTHHILYQIKLGVRYHKGIKSCIPNPILDGLLDDGSCTHHPQS